MKITLKQWEEAGFNHELYKSEKKRGKLLATRATRNHPVMIDVDSIKDEAKKQRIIAVHGDPQKKEDPADKYQTKYMAMSDKDRNKAWSMYHVASEFNKIRFEAKNDTSRKVDDALDAFCLEFKYADRWAEHRNVLSNSKGEVPAKKTIYKWARKLIANPDPYSLLEPKIKKENPDKFTEEQQKYIFNLYAKTHQPTIAMVHRSYNEICIINGWPQVTYEQVRKYINLLELTEGSAIDKARYGKKYAHDKHEPYVERDYSKCKFFDVLVADGKKLDFFIKEGNKKVRPMFVAWQDVATDMMMGFEQSLTESTVAVASSFRMAMINGARLLGQKDAGLVPREVYTDNGRAFKNHYWDGNPDFGRYQEGIFAAFAPYGLKYITRAHAYNGPAKTIERKFGDFIDIEKRVPTHCGNSPGNVPAQYRRNELMAKEQYDIMLNEFGWLDLQGSYNMMAGFVGQMNQRPGNGKKLNGLSPLQLAMQHIQEENTDYHLRIVSIRALDEMMMHQKTVRLERNGVRINGIPYYNMSKMALLPKDRGLEFIVKWSPFDTENVLVYNTDGTFLCEAEKCPWHNVPASYKQMGSEGEEKMKTAMQAKGVVEKLVDKKARLLAGLPEKQTRKKQPALEAAKLGELPKPIVLADGTVISKLKGMLGN